MPRATIELIVALDGSDNMYLAFSLGVGGGPVEFAIFPSNTSGEPRPYPFGSLLEKLAGVLKIDALRGVATLSNGGIWQDVFDVDILPEIRVTPSGANPNLQAVLKVFHGDEYGLTIGVDPVVIGGLTIQIQPQITIYEFGIRYTQATGLKLDAVVDYGEVGDNDRPVKVKYDRKGTFEPPKSAQKVSYPFPMPTTKAKSSFCLHYLGLGQRFGIDVDLNDPNPITKALTDLEGEFKETTPANLLPKLATHYHPDRNWFIAAHMSLRGWDLKAIFNDPALYGMEISCNEKGAFRGLDFAIFYQQLGPGNGVFYGAITLPETLRRIQLGAAALTLPNFKLWIYTNGDFRFEVGWPPWNNSLTVEVGIYRGGGGLYFGKLRSGDLPSTTTTIEYNPILEFGLALELGLGRDFAAGPVSASLFVGLRGVFQGLLAWKATNDLNNSPDYYWFSASVSLIGTVRGVVNLGIVSLSFSLNIGVSTGVAFETDCRTEVVVSAWVAVSASVRIVFVDINVNFNTTVSATFTLVDGAAGTANPDRPNRQGFQNAIPRAPGAPAALQAPTVREGAVLAPVELSPPAVALHFLLYPAVDYAQPGNPEFQAVCGLVIERDDFLSFLTSVAGWLISTYGKPKRSWDSILTKLGQGNAPAPQNFRDDIARFLSTGSFTIHAVDLTSPRQARMNTYLFAMPPGLELSSAELPKRSNREHPAPREFAANAKRGLRYGEVIEAYLSAVGRLEGSDVKGSGYDDDRSMADLVFYDYLLLVCRQLAYEMAVKPELTAPTEDIAQQVGGVASHYLLHGLRLPKPGIQIPEPGQTWDEHDIAGLYALTGQQFPVKPPGGQAGTIGATLSRSPGAGALAQAFRFAPDGTSDASMSSPQSVTSYLPLPAVPPLAPNPAWSDSLKRRPGIVSADLWLGAHNRVRWTHTNSDKKPSTRGLVPMPPRISELPDAETVKLTLHAQPHKGAPKYGFSYALRIPLDISTIPRHRDVDATWSNAPEGTNLAGTLAPGAAEIPGVYRIHGVADADRDRLRAIIRALPEQKRQPILHVLLPASDEAAFTSDESDECAAWFLKTNLTTVSSPDDQLPFRERAVQKFRPPSKKEWVAARITDVSGVLQLLDEVSIVHSGGFYLSWPGLDGNGLPATLFKDGKAELELLILMPGASLRKNIQNALVTRSEAEAALYYLAVTDGDGKARPDFQPSLPQGWIGFELDWKPPAVPALTRDPFDAAVIQNLYQLMQFRIDGSATGSQYRTSMWSRAVGPISPGQDAPATYCASLPIWKYRSGVNEKDPAQALKGIGDYVTLDFRLVDVFGNALSSDTRSMAVQRLYGDPLVPPSMWPGAHLDYRISGDGTSDPTLTVTLSFEPDSLLSEGSKQDLPQLIQRYQQIAAQVVDPNLTVGLGTSLVSAASIVENARDKLQDFAISTLAYIQAPVVPQTTKPPPTPIEITATLTRSDAASLPYNLFPLTVDMTLSRPRELVDPAARVKLPAVESVIIHVPPHMEGIGEISSSSLQPFARAFETAYAGFDGEPTSKLKLATSAEKANQPNPAAASELWAVRMSSKSGLALAVPNVQPVALTMQPFSTELVSGTVEVTTFDSMLNPTTAPSIFNGIAPDEWMQSFLFALDSLLSPSSAPVIAQLPALDPATNGFTPFERLIAAKGAIAKCLADRVVFVAKPEHEQGTDWQGDPAAQDRFRQSLLENLSRAYTTSVIMQTQIEMSQIGEAEKDVMVQPRFYGALPPHALSKDPNAPSSAFTISTAKLALPEPGAPVQLALTWAISVKEPERDGFLDLKRDYRIGFLEHGIEVDADGEGAVGPNETRGYKHSSWLRFIITEDQAQPGQPDPLLNYALPAARVPVPRHEFPPTPTIASQNAKGHPWKAGQDASIAEIITAALRWDYTLTVAERELSDAQDFLRVILGYNLPGLGSEIGRYAAPDPLFAALAQFTTAYRSLSPLLPQLQVGARPTVDLSRLTEILAGLAENITNALVSPDKREAPSDAPKPFTDTYDVAFLPARDALDETKQAEFYLTVYARTDSRSHPVIWPTINGQTREPEVIPVTRHGSIDGLWEQAKYPCSIPGNGKLPQLELAWKNFNIIERQTVRPQAQIFRNAGLAENVPGMMTNPKLVYRTPLITGSRLVPYLDVVQAIDVQLDTDLPTSLSKILAPFLAVGATIGAALTFRVKVGYEYALSTDSQGNPLVAAIPILLVDGVELNDQAGLDRFVEHMDDQIAAWMREFDANNEVRRWITLTIDAFTNLNQTDLPLVRLTSVRIPLDKAVGN